MDIFSKRLKYLREKKKQKDTRWTQEYVADLIGVARPTYTAYESDTNPKQPPLETVNKLADAFDTTAEYLLGRTDDPNKETRPNYLESDWPEGVKVLRRANSELTPEQKKKMLRLIETYIETEETNDK